MNLMCILSLLNQTRRQVSILLTCIGPKGRDIFSTFTFAAESDSDKLEKVIEQFDTYCQPRKNVTFLRHKFFTCKGKSQRFDDYVTDLRHRAKDCEFGTLKEGLIKDILIVGLNDLRLREHLLRDLNLAKAIQSSQAAEETKKQARALAASEFPERDIDAIKKKPRKQKLVKSGKRNKVAALARYKTG